jgi:hypothetical protein
VALFNAGYDTDLPSYVDTKHLPEICDELGLPLHMTAGESVIIAKSKPYIVGIVQDRTGKRPLGHYIFTDKPEETLKGIKSEDIFAVIEIPKK